MKTSAWAAALATIILWAAFATIAGQLGNIPPFFLVGITLCLGSLVSIRHWRLWRVPARVFAFGAACIFAYHACLVTAFKMAPIAEANIINYLWPLLIVALSPRFVPGTRLHTRQIVGCVIAFLGSIAVIAPTTTRPAPGATELTGFALALCAAIVWAVYSLYPRRLPSYSSWAVSGFCLGAGVISLVAHAAFEPVVSLAATDCMWLLAIAAGPTGISFVLWDYALRHGKPSIVGNLAYLTPALSTLFLGMAGAISDDTGWRIVTGLALVMIGVLLGRTAPRDTASTAIPAASSKPVA